jgi:hypothetical protein
VRILTSFFQRYRLIITVQVEPQCLPPLTKTRRPPLSCAEVNTSLTLQQIKTTGPSSCSTVHINASIVRPALQSQTCTSTKENRAPLSGGQTETSSYYSAQFSIYVFILERHVFPDLPFVQSGDPINMVSHVTLHLLGELLGLPTPNITYTLRTGRKPLALHAFLLLSYMQLLSSSYA